MVLNYQSYGPVLCFMMSELRPCRSKALDIRTEVCISKVHDVSELKHTYTDIKFMKYQKYSLQI